MYHEYERLRRARVGGSFTTALSAGAEGRNRYSNVLPFDANRVRLQVLHGRTRVLVKKLQPWQGNWKRSWPAACLLGGS